MASRREFMKTVSTVLLATTVGIAVFGLATSLAQDETPRQPIDSREFVTPETQDGVNRGLEWLASRQLEDGSFGTVIQNYRGNPGVAGLCGMAFLASGSTP